ncbi:MAG TPA: GFA family protein [Dongiaceae bacterium]|nr:GFA family protein [Dongiaceae bacterium]
MTPDRPPPAPPPSPAAAKVRSASCLCGRLALEVAGDPFFVLACNCTQCQRRTGSSFGLSAYFHCAQIRSLDGEERCFNRQAESGRIVQTHFCPHCGTTLYWTGPDGSIAEHIGVAGGCFADADFPAPQLISWNRHQAHWLDFPAGTPSLATQPDKLKGPD